MPFLFLIAAVVGVVALTRSERRAHVPPPRISGAPSPIAVLCAHLRSDLDPPPFVIHCAIAEAQIAGRHDLAQTFGQLLEPRDTISSGVIHAAPRAPAGRGASFDGGSMFTPAQPADMPDPNAVDPSLAQQAIPQARASDGSGNLASVIPSPIAGVDHGAWSHFCGALIRESPDFVSQRNVGRYRHRKDRLAEIGIDPDSIVGSPDAQDAAWCADLADAHRHIVASGMLRHVGRPVAVPTSPDGDVEKIPVTLSGILGVAGVAGLEGCAGWLENKADRKRFPHTTQAFMRTNGVF